MILELDNGIVCPDSFEVKDGVWIVYIGNKIYYWDVEDVVNVAFVSH